MDPAEVGVMRIGYFRIGVTVAKFDVALEQLKNVPSPRKATISVSPVAIGGVECRIGVFTTHFESLKKRFEKV